MRVDAAFPENWRVWWKALQPGWRTENDMWPMSRTAPVDEDWSSLAKGGKNGFAMILFGLVWWACVADECKDAAMKDELESAVEDVKWVMEEIVRGLTEGGPVLEGAIDRGAKGKKRAADDSESVRPGKRRLVLLSDLVT